MYGEEAATEQSRWHGAMPWRRDTPWWLFWRGSWRRALIPDGGYEYRTDREHARALLEKRFNNPAQQREGRLSSYGRRPWSR